MHAETENASRPSLSERLHITVLPVSTPVPWTSAMSYERVEFVSVLHEWLRLSVFRRDDVIIRESHRYYCSVGLPPTEERVLCLFGKAARTREPLYLKLVRHVRHSMITDLDVDVRFGTQVGDRLPLGIRVAPLIETPHFRAARYWRRAYWAMRCGIVRKIAETRSMAQQRINASSGPASSSAAKRHVALYRAAPGGGRADTTDSPRSSRPHVPMSTYHAECASSSVDLDRLCVNAPTLVIVWASWDAPSVAWLEAYVFPPGGGDKVQPGQSGDAWVSLLKRYTFVPEKTTWANVMAHRGRGMKRSVSPPQDSMQRDGTSPLSDVEAAEAASPSLCKRGNIVLVSVDSDLDAANAAMGDFERRARFWRSGDISMSTVWAGPQGLQSDLAVDLDVHALPLVIACGAPESPGVAPLVKELDQGEIARDRRRSTSRRRSSIRGHAGAHQPIEEFSSRVGLPMWHDVNPTERERILGVVADVIQRNDAPLVLESVVNIGYPAVEEGSDDVDTLRYETETDLLTHGVTSSYVSLRGSCCKRIFLGGDAGALDAIQTIATRVRNGHVEVDVFSPSAPLQFVFDTLTPEHRVKGAYWCVTCMHCQRNIRTEREAHCRCLHCSAKQCTICVACYDNRLHPAHHVCVKVRHTTADVCSEPIWGSSNVGVLPTMHGKVLANASNIHHDSVCNGCKTLIQGARWKCCCCHEFELCSRCEAAWWDATDGSGGYKAMASSKNKSDGGGGMVGCVTQPQQGGRHRITAAVAPPATKKSQLSCDAVSSCVFEHPMSHYMLHVRAPLIGNASSFLHPACERLEFPSTF
jgi:hypothetical protein